MLHNLEKGTDDGNNNLRAKFFSVLKSVKTRDIDVKYVKTKDQLADIMTKPCISPSLENTLTRLGARGVIEGDAYDEEEESERVLGPNRSKN